MTPFFVNAFISVIAFKCGLYIADYLEYNCVRASHTGLDFCMYSFIGVFSKTFLFLKKIKFGHFMKVLKFSDSILGLILVTKSGSEGVKQILFFSSILTQNTCVPKMKFLGLKMKKFLFAGYTLPFWIYKSYIVTNYLNIQW